MNNERALARSIAESITITTPGRVTWMRIRRRKAAPLLVILSWLPVIVAVALGAIAVITK